MRRHAAPRAAGWTPRRSRLALPGRPGAVSARLLVVVLVLPLLVGIAGPPSARGDELSDAIARQKALAARVKEQREQVAKIRALQGGLAQEIASTQTALAGINANLAADEDPDHEDRRPDREGPGGLRRPGGAGGAARPAGRRDRRGAGREGRRSCASARRCSRPASARPTGPTGRPLCRRCSRPARSPTCWRTSARTWTSAARIGRWRARSRRTPARWTRSAGCCVETRVGPGGPAQGDAGPEAPARRPAEGPAGREGSPRRAPEGDGAPARHPAGHLRPDGAERGRPRGGDRPRRGRPEEAVEARSRRSSPASASLGNIPSEYNGTLRWPMSAHRSPRSSAAPASRGSRRSAAAPTSTRGSTWRPRSTRRSSAAGDGVVVFAGPNPYDPYPKAWIVIIAHSESLQTWYAHVDNGVRAPPVSRRATG